MLTILSLILSGGEVVTITQPDLETCLNSQEKAILAGHKATCDLITPEQWDQQLQQLINKQS